MELHSRCSSSSQVTGLLREGFGTKSTQSAGIGELLQELKSISARLSQVENSIDPKHSASPHNTLPSVVPVVHLYGA